MSNRTRHLMSAAGLVSLAALSAALDWPLFACAEAGAAINKLEARAEALTEDMSAILAAADAAGRDATKEELAELAKLKEKRDAIDAQIVARSAIEPVSRGRRTTDDRGGDNRVPAQAKVDDPKGGFTSFGEFAVVARAAVLNPGQADKRIMAAAPSTVSTEGVGADGGFAVPPEFRKEIWIKVMGEEALIQKTDQLVTGANSMVLPADETTPWASSGGIQAYWEGENIAQTASKIALQPKSIRLNKLTALVPITEELLEDAPGLDGYLRTKAPLKMRAKLNTGIVRGTGVGMPMGILSSPSLITVSQAAGSPKQGAATIVYDNIVAMWARMYSECRRNAVWLINQDIEPQLDMMAFARLATQKVPVYLPAGGASASPYATLKGRPVIPMQACSTLGTVGDIILVDPTQYMTVTKGTDIRTDISMHLYFDAAALAYRFILRVTGQPWWGASIAPENGSTTLSWAVALSSTRA